MKSFPKNTIITGKISKEFEEILTLDCLEFVADLHRKFNSRRLELLKRRQEVQKKIDGGWRPNFLDETKSIREKDWKILGVPNDLQDRRVEITGPTNQKMIINALNSGASCFMADLEDSATPAWNNVIEGQINLKNAINKKINFTDKTTGKEYKLNEKHAVLIVRPRGWHLDEAHFLVDNEKCSGGIFDFAIYFYHNAKQLIKNGTGPYFYLPKMESHLEARLWNDVFTEAQKKLGIKVGLNCGRWDYIFSYIKKFKNFKDFLLPDRSIVKMTSHFLRSYSLLLIKTCHRRGAHAMGGMAAQIPIKDNEALNQKAMDAVKQDKLREANDGHDGTWVAHPGLVKIAKDVFDEKMPQPNQVNKIPSNIKIEANDLLLAEKGDITEDGLRKNISVGIQYLAAWLGGNGCVPLYNLMEDAATAEISRAQVWQWNKHQCKTIDGKTIDPIYVKKIVKEEMVQIKKEVGEQKFEKGNYERAAKMFEEMSIANQFEDFLTVPAYNEIIRSEAR
ncbi:MAG: malate synthase [Candidatus Fonsibacter ubiquis]|nr:malate synthase [Candidatus Fonsibacter ubiquis]